MPSFNMVKVNLSPGLWIYWLLCAFFFVLPLGTSPFTIVGACLLGVWLLSGEFLRKRNSYLRATWFAPVAAMVILVWAGLIWSPDPFGLGLKYAKKTHYWLYAPAVASMAFSKDFENNIFKAFMGGLLLNCIVGFLQVGHIVPTFAKKTGYLVYTGFSSGYNTLAILLVLGMMIASFYFRNGEKKKERLVYLTFIVTYFVHLIILGGRGGDLLFVLLSPVIIYNLRPGKGPLSMLLLYAVIILIMCSFPIVRDRVTELTEDFQKSIKLDHDGTYGKTYSGYVDRIYMWRWAFDFFIEHPILGVGTGGYHKSILLGGGEKGIAHPHNNFLYIAVSFGTVGLFVFGWLFWVLLKAGWQNREDPLGFFIMASSLVILVGGLTDTHILDAGGAFLLSITAGLQSALLERKVNRRDKSVMI